jgi:peptidoglycan/LPS O-acetylase OafA/YrhL
VDARAEVAPRGRDRYIDSLRALALIRVVSYHLLGWAWLPLVFPSMGVMFALGGALVAASLSRGAASSVVRKRLRRLLPPLWALGAVLIPVMLWQGWTADPLTFSGTPLSWHALLLWVVPIYTPGGSAWASDLVLPLWYVRTYLWFLLLSPALLWLWRRWPRRTLAAPLGVLAVFTSGVVVGNGSRTDEVTLTLATFGACWLLGFAHHDGSLRRLPKRLVVPAALALLTLGAWWAHTHPAPGLGANIDNIPFANGMYCLGYVLLLLRFYPSFDWLARRRLLDRAVSALNARAMTIYLWGNIAGAAALVLEKRYVADRWYADGQDNLSRLVQYVLMWALIGGIVLAVGWVEDVAAGRRARLLPWPAARPRPAARHAAPRQRRPAPMGTPYVPAATPPPHLVIDLRDGVPPQATLIRAGGPGYRATAPTAVEDALRLPAPSTARTTYQ